MEQTIHEKDMRVNKNKLDEVLYRRGMNYIELHTKMYKKYGLDLTYKSFMGLIQNRSSWKLLYAHALSDVLLINYTEVFDLVDVNKEEEKEKRAKWKKKYQN